MRSKILLTTILYIVVAVASTGTAMWTATFFMRKSYAQNPPAAPLDPNGDPITKQVLQSLQQENAPSVPPSTPPAATPTSEVPPAPTAQAEAPAAANNSVPPPSPSKVTVTADGFLQMFEYIQGNRRDPFESPQTTTSEAGVVAGPTLPLQNFDLDELKCTAIIWDVARPMAMIRDPKGIVHIVTPNDKIGKNNGYVAVIREGELVVVEPIQTDGRVVFTTKIMKLAQ